MKLHELKIMPEYWVEVANGNKTFELRKNDRDFKKEDLIHFIVLNNKGEIDYEKNSYAWVRNNVFKITYVLKDVEKYGLDKEYCILAIKRIDSDF